MCTVSVIPVARGFRVMVNRDESVLRPAALPPAWRTILAGDGTPIRAIWPVDPSGGGTWVGASERGLLLTLLNYNLESAPGVPREVVTTGLRSRGEIIPQLLTHATADDAASALERSDLRCYGPFRLLAIDHVGGQDAGPRIREMRWDMQTLDVREAVTPPACFASSGLGDSLVRVRGDLFSKMVSERGAEAATQEAFHEHAWPHATHLSVMMSRKGVQTVSVSTVEVSEGAGASRDVRFEYRAIARAENT
ncbi:MAG TPA: NRDE family protein [Phycisphaerales bacterium]|nr:NRDE family protein [Phycisphaerales bacterium]